MSRTPPTSCIRDLSCPGRRSREPCSTVIDLFDHWAAPLGWLAGHARACRASRRHATPLPAGLPPRGTRPFAATRHDAAFTTECANPIRWKPASLNAHWHKASTACEQMPRPRHAGTIQYATPAETSWKSTPLSDTRPIRVSVARSTNAQFNCASSAQPAFHPVIHCRASSAESARRTCQRRISGSRKASTTASASDSKPRPQHGDTPYRHPRMS